MLAVNLGIGLLGPGQALITVDDAEFGHRGGSQRDQKAADHRGEHRAGALFVHIEVDAGFLRAPDNPVGRGGRGFLFLRVHSSPP